MFLFLFFEPKDEKTPTKPIHMKCILWSRFSTCITRVLVLPLVPARGAAAGAPGRSRGEDSLLGQRCPWAGPQPEPAGCLLPLGPEPDGNGQRSCLAGACSPRRWRPHPSRAAKGAMKSFNPGVPVLTPRRRPVDAAVPSSAAWRAWPVGLSLVSVFVGDFL